MKQNGPLRVCPLMVLLTIAFLGCSGGEDASRAGAESAAEWEAGSEGAETLAADVGEEKVDSNELLKRARQPFFGDLPEIRERRFLRVLVSYGKTSFFYGGGDPPVCRGRKRPRDQEP